MMEISKSPYEIISVDTVFLQFDKLIGELKPSSIFILTDENVIQHCLPLLSEKSSKVKNATVIEIPAGEEEKSFTSIAKILSFLFENNADRNSLLINIGGGVVCDIGGFAASIYKRGIRFINMPTTLLAMVDASVGGKNGINFLGAKNVIGTFNNPEGVFINPAFTETLPQREFLSGYAEIIKHILLSDENGWKEFLNDEDKLTGKKYLSNHISTSVKFKSEIVTEDFRENGRRKILNFGHTIGHALESVSLATAEPLKHGEAVAAGMVAELFLSSRHAGFPEKDLADAVIFIRNVFSDINLSFVPEDLIPVLYADKKNANDMIGFSLLKQPGKPAGLFFPPLDSIVECLNFMFSKFSTTAA